MNDILQNNECPFESLQMVFMNLKKNLPAIFGDVQIDLTPGKQIKLSYNFEEASIKPLSSSDNQRISVELMQGGHSSCSFTIDITSQNPMGVWPQGVFPSLYVVMASALMKMIQVESLAQEHASTVESVFDSALSSIEAMVEDGDFTATMNLSSAD